MTKVLGGIVLAACIILAASCGSKSTTDSESAPAPVLNADGATTNLPHLSGPPKYFLDRLGAVVIPSTAKAVPISSTDQVAGMGWAADGPAQLLAGGVDIVIDGKAYAAKYGAPRPDVAKFLKVPAYTACGFSFSFPAAAFEKGKHRLSVRVLNHDKTGYWESDTFPFECQ